MNEHSKDLRRKLLICLVTCLAVSGAIVGLRMQGRLQAMECVTYDAFIRTTVRPANTKSPVTIVGMTEQDIQTMHHYPATDGDFATLLNQLLSLHPRAIGVDFFRDIPTGTAAEQQQLKNVLSQNRNIVWIKLLEGTPGPSVLEKTGQGQEQLGFNDFPEDPDHIVRRGFLFADDSSGQTQYSFALRLALLYLKAEHIRESPGETDPDLLRLGRTTFEPLSANFGPYGRVDNSGYQFALDYREARAFLDFIPMSDALAGKVNPLRITDRIVLIGPVTDSVKDRVDTPFFEDQFEKQFGVQVHASVTDQIIRAAQLGEAPMRSWPLWKVNSWIVLWGLIGGTLGLTLRSLIRFAIWAVLAIGVIVLIGFVSFQHGLFVPLLPPIGSWFVSGAMVTAYMSYRETSDRRAIMTLFGRHVSDDVAQNIWDKRQELFEKGRLIAREMEATVLFTDLRGFSRVGQSIEPTMLMDWLNDYFQNMSGLVKEHGGSISKFIGDSIMALFGPPLVRSREEQITRDAINAVECALAMRRALAEMNAAWTRANRPTTQMRIGICTGKVVAGSLGSLVRLEYTVIGDTVNTASRLESHQKDEMDPDIAADGCRILISDSTRRRLPAEYQTRSLGPILFHSMVKPTVVHGVIGKQPAVVTTRPVCNERTESCEPSVSPHS